MTILPIKTHNQMIKARQAILSGYGQEYPDILTCQFSSRFESSLILMDYSGGIDGNLLRAISTTAQSMGDQGFYLSYPVPVDERLLAEHQLHRHWYISFDGVANYLRKTETFVYRYIHYSPQGIWGIVASDGVFGVLSGTSDFIQRVLQLAPEIRDDTHRFIVYWLEHKKRHGLNIEWVSLFLQNVYGESEAAKFASLLST